MKQFKSKKDWIRYCEKNFVYRHPDYKDCPKGIIFYHLKNDDLINCEYETLLEVDNNRVELTIQERTIE